MSQPRNRIARTAAQRMRVFRWGLVLCGALALGALATSQAGDAQLPPTESEPAAMDNAGPQNSALAPLVLNPEEEEDPYVTFQRWRIDNRITIIAPHHVVEARQRWLDLHPSPGSGSTGTVHRHSLLTSSLPTRSSLGVSVGTNVDVGGVRDYQGELAVAVNPNNSQQLVGGANTFFFDPNCPAPGGSAATQALYGSADGGNTWAYACAPWPASLNQGSGPLFFGSDPAVAWDASGNAYASYMLISEELSGVFSDAIVVAKSTNSGISWSPLGAVINNLGNPAVFEDKDFMAIDTTSGGAHSFHNRIYIIWDENNTEMTAHSDNGTTWTRAALETSGDLDIGGDVAIAPDGTVYVIWNRLGFTGPTQTGESTVFSSSTDGGDTWSAPLKITNHNLLSFGANRHIPAQDQRGINAFGAIAVDRDSSSPNLGGLYVVYGDFATSSSAATDTNVYLVRSTNGGSTWSAPLQINDDSGTASQFFPWIDVDQSTGNLVVSWYDTRNDPNNRRTQIFAAQSTNGGLSFSANQLVTSVSPQFTNAVAFSDENSTDNINFNPNQYGDYHQIATLDGIAHPLWCDTRMYFPGDTTNPVAEEPATAQVSFGVSDTTPPTIAITSPTGGATYGINQPVAAKYSCTDPDDTVATCSGPVASGSNIDTSTGMHTFTVKATDSHGNASSKSVSYTVPPPVGPLIVTPSSLNFRTKVGTTSRAKSVTLKNPKTNSGPAIITSISTGTSEFAVGGSCSNIPAGGKCKVPVTATPNATGVQSDTLTINDNGSNAPQQVGLSVVGK